MRIHLQIFAGRIVMAEELESFHLYAQQTRIKLDSCATANALTDTRELVSTVIKPASQVGVIKDFSVDSQNMEEDQAMLGKLQTV